MMKITESHCQYWLQKKAPKFLRELKGQFPVSVHQLIPQPEEPDWGFSSAATMVSLTKSVRERGVREKNPEALTQWLAQVARYGGTVHRPKTREAFARKWLMRILRQRNQKTCKSKPREDMKSSNSSSR